MKLEDIPKKQIYEVPDGYFDKLPGIIQSRVAEQKARPVYMRFALRYAMPLVVLSIALFFIFRASTPARSPEELLAAVSSEELTYYLVESDFSTEELLDNIDVNEVNVNELNEEILPYSDLDIDVLEEFANELPIEL